MVMQMLDLDAILNPLLSHGTAQTPKRDRGAVPCETQHPRGFDGDFVAMGQRDRHFDGGEGEKHNCDGINTLTPAAPDECIESRQPEKAGHTLSHLSFKSESEYLCGFPADFNGTAPPVPGCPVCPVTPDDLEARIERAAIMEYDGGLSRADAETAAGLDCWLKGTPTTFPLAGTKRRGIGLGFGVGA